ncbi:MAG: DNA/RNA non-specific endonuclease, partial [Acinetobacter sp.]
HWDAESQCAEDVSKDQIQALQKQFQPKSATSSSDIQLPKVDEETKDALVKQLVEALLQYILQILK